MCLKSWFNCGDARFNCGDARVNCGDAREILIFLAKTPGVIGEELRRETGTLF